MEPFDVVIIGSGISGAITGDYLAARKHSVLILEAGPENHERQVLTERYLSTPEKPFHSPHKWNKKTPRPEGGNRHYVQTGPEKFQSDYERCLGGTTWHWLGTCLRLLPSDLKMKSTYQKAVDWPLEYKDLEPWYCLAEQELGVAGNDREDLGSPRSAGYPRKPLPLSYFDQTVKRSLHNKPYKSTKLHVSANPQARDPDLCQGSRSCIPLCPLGAKYEARQHLERAKERGALVFPESVVDRLEVNSEGLVESVRYITGTGKKRSVRAKYCIVAANGIETPRLLLMSRTSRFPEGLANSSGCVGRYLMDHPVLTSFGLSGEPVSAFRGPLSTAGIDSLRDGRCRSEYASFRVELMNRSFESPGAVAEAFIGKNLYGRELQVAVRNYYHRMITFGALLEQLPLPENRVRLSGSLKDPLGLPRPEISFRTDSYTSKGFEEAEKVHRFLFRRLSGTRTSTHRQLFGAGHIMGTCRMGMSPLSSVTDSFMRSHDHKNLFIAGAAVFPTGGTANPTLTIAALALRTARHLDRELSTVADLT